MYTKGLDAPSPVNLTSLHLQADGGRLVVAAAATRAGGVDSGGSTTKTKEERGRGGSRSYYRC